MKIQDLKYLLAYLIPVSAFIALEWQSFWSYSAMILGFGIIPIVELILKPNPKNDTPELELQKSKSLFFDILLYLNIPIVYFLIYKTIFTVLSGVETWEGVGMFLNLGLVLATSGINVAHEIGHRPGKVNKILAASLLIPSLYGHFTTEHNHWHHKYVATPDDPATAKYNQSFYQFLFSAVIGVYRNAWTLAFKDMERKGKPKWHYSNEMLWITFFQILLFTSYYMIGGPWILLFCFGTAVMSFSLLESIDYVEHYGLERKKLPSGKYERVNEKHSWNSDHELGRIFLYELTRHTDHHMNAVRKYQVLRHKEDSPQLPFGYPGSIILALFPPLWFKIMNPRIKALS